MMAAAAAAADDGRPRTYVDAVLGKMQIVDHDGNQIDVKRIDGPHGYPQYVLADPKKTYVVGVVSTSDVPYALSPVQHRKVLGGVPSDDVRKGIAWMLATHADIVRIFSQMWKNRQTSPDFMQFRKFVNELMLQHFPEWHVAIDHMEVMIDYVDHNIPSVTTLCSCCATDGEYLEYIECEHPDLDAVCACCADDLGEFVECACACHQSMPPNNGAAYDWTKVSAANLELLDD